MPLLRKGKANWIHSKFPGVLVSHDVVAGGTLQIQEHHLQDYVRECAAKKDVTSGRLIYMIAVSSGLGSSCFLGDQLIRLFAACGTLLEASLVFCNVNKPNLHVWHAIISAHAEHGCLEKVFSLFHQLYIEGMYPNEYIFPVIFKACGSFGYLVLGKLIHAIVTEQTLESSTVVGSSLMYMYIKFKQLEEAQRVFDHLKERNVVAWSSIIDGYAHHGDGIVALKLYERMSKTSLKPDKVVFLCVLKACSKAGAIREGLLIHDQIIKSELELDVTLGNTLVDMYAKCKELRSAHRLFQKLNNPNAVSWGALITGYAQNGQGDMVLELYEEMDDAFSLNEMILPCILKACANAENLAKGKEIHKRIEESGFEFDVVVKSSLVDMYAKCGSLEEAQEIFSHLRTHNLVSWGAMISGYMQQGKGRLVLDFFKDMLQERLEPDNAIFICVLKACASIGALKLGRLVHHFISENVAVNIDVALVGAIVDMYARCGSLEEAHGVVTDSFRKNPILWSAIISGYARSGDWKLVRWCLECMQQEGVQLNEVTFTNVLSAFSHAGEVEEGQHVFKSVAASQSNALSFENLTCMIDLLGSTGQLEEANHLLETLPVGRNVIGWTSLMTACKTYGNVNLGHNCFHQVSELEPDGAGFALMSSIYAEAQLWGDADKTGPQVSGHSWKKPGIAWIEANNNMEEFMVGDRTHKESPKIYATLKRLNRALKTEGYVPVSESITVNKSVNEEVFEKK
ncbi:hypothetical protein KP509_37G034100 [Ceratopteris richardii]|nr:hypothetical protein KP509_37G034100 [Ceratopteris richardii]